MSLDESPGRWTLETPFAEWEGEALQEAPRTASAHAAGHAGPVAGRFYLRITGAVQGAFGGDVTRAGRDDWLAAVGFSQELEVPHTTDGRAVGRRRLRPIVILRDWSGASPQLYAAAASNEQLRTVVIEFVAATATGAEQTAQRITLTNASIAGLRRSAGELSADRRAVEQISLVFERFELEDLARGRRAVDAWGDAHEVEEAPPTSDGWTVEAHEAEEADGHWAAGD